VLFTDNPRLKPGSELLFFTNPRSTMTITIKTIVNVTNKLTFSRVGYSLLLKAINLTMVESITITDIAAKISINALLLVIIKLN